ncbi:hypothetical protein GOBAR_DD36952 [Gossypium barbadense]|nr:hypothetical protein GOBAR_DD36952 [Gossypium barbadense]
MGWVVDTGQSCVTVFVVNLPPRMQWRGLWNIFEYHGMGDASSERFHLFGHRIWVNFARFKGSGGIKGFSRYERNPRR